MATTSEKRIRFEYTSDTGNTRTISFDGISQDEGEITTAKVQTLATALVTNKAIFKEGYQPTTIKRAYTETTETEDITIS